MRRASMIGRLFAAMAVVMLVLPSMASVAHAIHHGDHHAEADGGCVMCLAHVSSPCCMRGSVPVDAPDAEKHWTAPDHPSLLHPGHGSPLSSRGPPVSQA